MVIYIMEQLNLAVFLKRQSERIYNDNNLKTTYYDDEG